MRTDQDPAHGELLVRIGRNSGYAILRGFVLAGSILLLTPLVLHFAGLDGYGAWAMIKALSAYLLLTDVGIGFTVTRYSAQYLAMGDGRGINRMFNTYLVVFAAIGLVVFTVIYANTGWIVMSFFKTDAMASAELVSVVRLGAAIVIFTQVLTLYTAVLNGLQRLDLASRVGMVTGGVSLGLSILALLFGFGVPGLLVADGLAAIAGALAYEVVCRQKIPSWRLDPRLFDIHELWRVRRFNALTATKVIVGVFHYHTDKLIISYFLGLQALALYDLGLRVVSMIASPFGAVVLAVLPAVAFGRASSDEPPRQDQIFDSILRFTAFVAVPSFLFVAVFAPVILKAWVGIESEEASLALRALAAVYLIGVLTSPGDVVLLGSGRVGATVVVASLTMAVSVGLSLVLVRALGLPGVLAAAMISRLIGAIVLMYVYGSTTGTAVWRTLLRALALPLCAALGLVAPVYLVVSLVSGPLAQATLALLLFGLGYALLSVRLGIHVHLLRLMPFARSSSV